MPWYRGDCHVHSVRSHGGELTPPQLAAEARAAGLDFIAITEHNATTPPSRWDALLVIPGQEVVTQTGHWLALGLDSEEPVDWRYGVRDDVVGRHLDRVRRAGGVSVAAHPHAPYPSGAFRYPFDGFDVVEVWNGSWRSGVLWQADNEAALAEWGRGLAEGVLRGRWRPAIGNSDIHQAGQIGTQTVVLADHLTTADILQGIRTGRSWLAESSSVQLFLDVSADDHTAGIGEHLQTHKEPAIVRLKLGGVPAGTVSFHTDRGKGHEVRLPADTVEWPTTAEESAFVRVEIRHPDRRMAALTNPVILT